jgi:hypothetical protein
MRYSLILLAAVLAGLGTLPQSASGQGGGEGATSEPNLEEPAPSSEPASEAPALQIELDDDSVKLSASSVWADERHMREVVEPRARKARAWLIATGVVTAIGVTLLAVGLTYDRRQPPSEGFDLDFTGAGLAAAGGILVAAGVVGMAVSGGTLGMSKRKLRRGWRKRTTYTTPRRVQWDLARSRLVF